MNKSHLKCVGIPNPELIYDQLNGPSTNPALYLQNTYAAVPNASLPQIRTEPLSTDCLILAEYAASDQCTTAIKPPAIGLIESGDGLADVCQRIGLFCQYDLIGFSITSLTASQYNFSSLLCASAQSHFQIPDKAMAPITLAVQEATINALAHGNLGLRSAFHETEDKLNHYYELMRARAQIETIKNQRLDLFSWATGESVFMAVKDHGDGYKPFPSSLSAKPQPPLIERRKSGRGLDIMRQFSQDFWLSAKGTSVVMRFSK